MQFHVGALRYPAWRNSSGSSYFTPDGVELRDEELQVCDAATAPGLPQGVWPWRQRGGWLPRFTGPAAERRARAASSWSERPTPPSPERAILPPGMEEGDAARICRIPASPELETRTAPGPRRPRQPGLPDLEVAHLAERPDLLGLTERGAGIARDTASSAGTTCPRSPRWWLQVLDARRRPALPSPVTR
jgi:hypothetical protein